MSNLTPAAFSDPAWMRAIMAHVPGAVELQPGKPGGAIQLLAMREKRFPVRHFESFVTPLTPSGLPAASRPPTQDEIRNVLSEIRVPMLFRGVPCDHPVTKALLAGAGRSKVLRSWQRAALKTAGSFETWMASNFDHKRRKELKRLRNRLAEQGALIVDHLKPGEDLDPFLRSFLHLEAAGWKGKRGTAIQKDPSLTKALVTGLAALHAKGRVRFWSMTLDGKPAASLFALVEGSEAVLGKICHDEALAKFSPGVLLIIEATEALFAEPGITRADANAIPGHPMIDRIWRDRLAVMDVLVACGETSSLRFAAVAAYDRARARARSAAKALLAKVLAYRRS